MTAQTPAAPRGLEYKWKVLISVVFGIFKDCAAVDRLFVSMMWTNTVIAFRSTSLSIVVHSENQFYV